MSVKSFHMKLSRSINDEYDEDAAQKATDSLSLSLSPHPDPNPRLFVLFIMREESRKQHDGPFYTLRGTFKLLLRLIYSKLSQDCQDSN